MTSRKKPNLKYNIEIGDFQDSARENGMILVPGLPTEITLFEEEIYAGLDSNGPGVEYTMSNKFIRNMNLIRLLNPNMPVLVHMNTTGGDWGCGMAIYDTIKTHPTPVTILDYRMASSMSSIILLAGDKRVMMPDTHFMYHDGWMNTFNTWKGYESEFEFLKKTYSERMWDIYTDALKEQGKYSGWSKKRIREMLHDNRDKKQDVYLTPEEAVEWGFADEVFDGDWERLTRYTKQQHQRKGKN
jgi:ATP-dependent protease ClpP protease subunit